MMPVLAQKMALGTLLLSDLCEPCFLLILSLFYSVVTVSVIGSLMSDDMDLIHIMAGYCNRMIYSKKHSESALWLAGYLRDTVLIVGVVLCLMVATSIASLYVCESGIVSEKALGVLVLAHLFCAVLGAFSSARLLFLMKLPLDLMSEANSWCLSYLRRSCYWRLFWAFVGTVIVSLSVLGEIVVLLTLAYMRLRAPMVRGRYRC